jgi:type II secretory pathway component PulK
MTDNLTLNMAKDMVQNRPKEGYGSVDVFLQQAAFSNMPEQDKQNLTSYWALARSFLAY